MPIQVVQALMVVMQTTKQAYITAIKFVFLSAHLDGYNGDL